MVPMGSSEKLYMRLSASQISQFSYNMSFLVIHLQLKTDLCVAETLLMSRCANGGQVNVVVKITDEAICSKSGKGLRPFLSSDVLGLCAFTGDQT